MYRLTTYILKILNTIYCILLHGNSGIIINSWTQIKFGYIKHRNWGDELNYYLLRELTEKKISNYTDLCKWWSKGKNNYLVIGSIIEDFTTEESIVWGSGVISGDQPLRHHPKKVLAVRGKLTRKYLLANGIQCPKVYGDPALLTPLIYQPKVKKKYRIGIIPHVSDTNHQAIKHLERQGAHLIHLNKYINWYDIIDEICMCEIIVSSSLHGLILSDAYKIPNIWATMFGNLIGGSFKFKDYFSAVGRQTSAPVILSASMSIAQLEHTATQYVPIQYNPKKLIEAAPWPLKFGTIKS